MAPLPAVFGITNDTLNLVVELLLLFLIAVWFALVFWAYADARRRIEDPMLIGCAAAASFFFPYVGTIVYLIVRPPEYLDDVRERELEIKAMEKRLGGRDLHCPVCRAEVESEFLICPVCTTKLRQACVTCHRPLEALWQICPYCETPIASDEETLALRTQAAERRSKERR